MNLDALDINAIVAAILKILFMIIRIPFDLWRRVPSKVKIGIYIILFIISIILLILAWKKRDAWLYVRY